jgi:hypothetical protein
VTGDCHAPFWGSPGVTPPGHPTLHQWMTRNCSYTTCTDVALAWRGERRRHKKHPQGSYAEDEEFASPKSLAWPAQRYRVLGFWAHRCTTRWRNSVS